MDNDEITLDEEFDTEEEENFADVTDDDSEDYDEFEYDEDGNVIIPDVVDFEENDDEEADESGKREEKKEKEEKEEKEDDAFEENENSERAEKTANSTSKQSDEKDARIAQLEAKLSKLEAQGKETLTKLGVKNGDVMEGLMSLAAEADGVSTQEYIRKKLTEERDAQARALLQRQEFEKIVRADLAELHSAYPETKQYSDIRMLPENILKKFGRFRDAGLSAKEAYAAANPDGIRNNVATAVKKKSLHDSKIHLRTAVPKGSKDDGIVMPKSEMTRWRELFPDMSDKEIRSLYKSTIN